MGDFFKFILDKGIFALIIYIIIGATLYLVFKNYIMHRVKKGLNKKRQETIKNIVLNIVKTIIVIIIIIKLLSIFGVNITSILAGLGIVGIVIGLALQDVMKDYLAGAFIIIEDQYDIGDLVEINGFIGEITSLSLRSTSIKNMYGQIKIMSNRTISEVKNLSKITPTIILDIPMPYEISTKKIDSVINKIKTRCEEEIDDIKGKISIWGLNEFSTSALKYRIALDAKMSTQYAVTRKINRIIKEEYENQKISIPYNIIEVKNGIK